MTADPAIGNLPARPTMALAPAGNALRVERVTDAEGLQALRGEWTALLAKSRADHLFLTWEWLSTWWKHLAGDRGLHLLAVRSGPDLVALAPLAMRPASLRRLLPVRALEFLGTGSVGSDYLDVIVRAGQETEALGALAGSLAGQTLMLELEQLDRATCLATALAGELERYGWQRSEWSTDGCPFIDLTGLSWPAYLARLDAKRRYNFKRRLDLLRKEFDFRLQRVASEAERQEALRALFTLHGQRWQPRGGSTAFHTPALRAFHEEFTQLALARGWLRLYVLWLDDQPVAALYGLRYRHVFYFYQTGFDEEYSRYGVGRVILGLTIREAIEEGATEYDLLHGTETYKFDWADQTRPLGRLKLYPPHLRGKLYQRIVRASWGARRLGRRVLPAGVVDWIAEGASLGLDRLLAGARHR